MKKKLLSLFILLLLVTPVITFAQSDITANLDTAAGNLKGQTLPQIVGSVINAFVSILGVILVSLMVYAGYMWMTAAGDPEKVKKAQGIIKMATMGIIITLAAWAIASYVIGVANEAATGQTGYLQILNIG